MRKQHGFFDQRNYIEKVRGNDMEIRQNLVFDLSTKRGRFQILKNERGKFSLNLRNKHVIPG